MKKLTLLIAPLMMALVLPAAAHEGAVAFVNIDRFYDKSVLVKAVNDKINADFRKRTEALRQLDKDLRAKQEALQKDRLTIDDTEREARESEIAAMQRKLVRDRQELSEDRALSYEKRRKVIDIALSNIIESVAKERNYDVVLNPFILLSVRGRALTHSILFYGGAKADITDEVIERFDKEAKLDE